MPDVLLESEKRAHLSSIGLVSRSPLGRKMQFFTTTFPGSATSIEMSCVLDELHKYFRNKIIVIWDSLQGHKGLENKYRRQHPVWFHFERLPTYSPELNVVEFCWNQIKNVEMANFVPKNGRQVVDQVQRATQKINEDKTLLQNFLKHIRLKR